MNLSVQKSSYKLLRKSYSQERPKANLADLKPMEVAQLIVVKIVKASEEGVLLGGSKLKEVGVLPL
jgi:hypothetical protein